MYHEDIHFYKWLTPLSWFYGIGVNFRNILFDKKILPSRKFDIPVISVGNLSVGGTGKTPHTEYLIRLLHKEFRVAVLSRGYKRQTKDYLLATSQSTAIEIGDEPFQMMKKFPDIKVAVDTNRCRGIKNLMTSNDPPIDVILLDDAYQHRYVTPGINILLTNCNRLFCDDLLLPCGRLREPIKGKERANIIIVTKCPDDIKPIDYNVIMKRLNLFPFQELYFSRFIYGNLYKLFNKDKKSKTIPLSELDADTKVLLLSGIANPNKLVNRLQGYVEQIISFSFPDHHDYTEDDIKRLEERFEKLSGEKRMIITTEKDAARLRSHIEISETVKEHLYVLPIRVAFLQDKEKSFNQIILDYVRKNKRNNRIY